MCLLCMTGLDDAGEAARRLHVLRLLDLVEHPDVLPREAALRLSREIMALIGGLDGRFQCDSVACDETSGDPA